jgi:hypothetical protein
VSVLVGLFPKELPKKKDKNVEDQLANVPRVMRSNNDFLNEESLPLKSNEKIQQHGSVLEIPTMKELPATILRLFKNKLLMSNMLSGVFYILGASA